ncbi:hypothetical protein PBI_INDLOVU_61 [Mycobacterium phage Indlovu]|nr:hypothetical protein PBI_INDLOVU_61 [Mycobacterium phage Indlovu]
MITRTAVVAATLAFAAVGCAASPTAAPTVTPSGRSVSPLELASSLTAPAPSWQPTTLEDMMLGPIPDQPHVGSGDQPGPATINLSEFGNIDAIPTCVEEDCSDQPGQIGLWLDRDTGNWWFSTGETSALVIDDTADARGVR